MELQEQMLQQNFQNNVEIGFDGNPEEEEDDVEEIKSDHGKRNMLHTSNERLDMIPINTQNLSKMSDDRLDLTKQALMQQMDDETAPALKFYDPHSSARSKMHQDLFGKSAGEM